MEQNKNTITLMLPEEYALMKGVSLKTVYNHIASGKIKSQKRYKKTFVEV